MCKNLAKSYKVAMQQPPPPPPGPPEWMPPPAVSNCPQGLEYLDVLDQLIIEQKIEAIEIATGFEQKNRFKVTNALGQKVYYAVEESDCLSRQMLGRFRPFQMTIFDNFRNEIMHLNRPYSCDLLCCFSSCNNLLEVSTQNGEIIGTIEQGTMCGSPKFHVKNQLGDVVCRIKKPACVWNCCSDQNFMVFDAKKKVIGKLTRKWGGIVKETYTDADNFRLTFPLELDVTNKALLLATVFLIDTVFYEH